MILPATGVTGTLFIQLICTTETHQESFPTVFSLFFACIIVWIRNNSLTELLVVSAAWGHIVFLKQLKKLSFNLKVL